MRYDPSKHAGLSVWWVMEIREAIRRAIDPLQAAVRTLTSMHSWHEDQRVALARWLLHYPIALPPPLVKRETSGPPINPGEIMLSAHYVCPCNDAERLTVRFVATPELVLDEDAVRMWFQDAAERTIAEIRAHRDRAGGN